MASDAYLKALGEVTVEASALEWCIAYLLAAARGGSQDYIMEITSRSGKARRALKELNQDVENEHAHKCLFSAGVNSLYGRTCSVLDQRNALVHSMEVIQLSERSGDILSVIVDARGQPLQHTSIDQLRQLAREIRGVGGTALRMSTRIAEWRSIHGDYWA